MFLSLEEVLLRLLPSTSGCGIMLGQETNQGMQLQALTMGEQLQTAAQGAT
jgi:hypothetical protein